YNSKYGHSHSNFLGMIADTLVEAGHNVTSLIPIMDKSLKDGTEKSAKIYVQPDPAVSDQYELMASTSFNFFEVNIFNPIIPLFVGPMMAKPFYTTCKRVVEEPALIERLKAEKFDVYIAESFDMCGIGLSHAIQPKAVIGSTSTNLFEYMFDEYGVPQAVSYRPTASLSSLDVNSFFDRLLNLYSSYISRAVFYFGRRAANNVLKEHFGYDYPTVAQQSANVAYVFTNAEPLIDFAAPTLSRVINVPGIGAKQPNALDKYWTEILSRREKTIIISFGSAVKTSAMPDRMKTAILTTISRFPDITFIWKYEEPEDEFSAQQASKMSNLVLTKWMPQVDILAHPRVAAFITHGGMGSTQETALRGVPGIFIPIFGDQPRNAAMMEYNGLGKVFNKFDLGDADKLTETVREVLEDPKYRENAQRISKMIARKPFTSKQQLIRHVEFAAEFGASAALRPQSLDMSFIEYHNLDLLLIVSNFIAICFFLIVKTVIFVFRIL
ncbi:hypothetical protein PFISCL1PPCAC_7252, partial [Pristionchus fissidentatus]